MRPRSARRWDGRLGSLSIRRAVRVLNPGRAAAEFARIPHAGKIAMRLTNDDPDILDVIAERGTAAGGGAALIATAQGKALRFSLGEVRIFGGRTSRGLRAIRLDKGDRVVSLIEVEDRALDAETSGTWTISQNRKSKPDLPEAIIKELNATDCDIVQIATSGHMKRTTVHAYRQARRDGKGVNDRGPSKAIGEIIALIATVPGHSVLHVETGPGTIEAVEATRVRTLTKAASGTRICRSALRVLQG